MTHKINSSKTAAVATNVHWLPIDQHTPQGVKIQLISRPAGVSMYGIWHASYSFYTHWAPLPTFAPDDEQPRFEYLQK